jgi:hypothetical protein
MIRRLLHRLDRAVTRRLLRDLREFKRAGVPHGHLTGVGSPSTSPLSLVDRYVVSLPQQVAPGVWPCCKHCESDPCTFTPHRDFCPDCQRGLA